MGERGKDTDTLHKGYDMSELKVYHHELRPNEYAEFYLKYEADKVIAEKDGKALAETCREIQGGEG